MWKSICLISLWPYKGLFKIPKHNKAKRNFFWWISLHVVISNFPGGLDGKESAWSAGDLGSIPGLGRSPEEGKNNPLQYSCLENSMDIGAWWATVYGITELDTTEQLTSNKHHYMKTKETSKQLSVRWKILRVQNQ